MNRFRFSRHGEARMRQRGIRTSDVELILQYGSEIGEDVFFLSQKDAEREISRRKREIDTLERLRNKKLVLAGDTVVTCYHSRRSDQKRMLRYGRKCA